MRTPIVVAEFEPGASKPSARDLVDAAAGAGAAFVAVDVVDGEDETPEAHLAGRRVAQLARLAKEASQRDVGLFLRLRDSLAVFGLRDALGVAKGTTPQSLRDRLVVVVPSERVGKRLRHDARELPSAFELPSKRRGLARFVSPNFLRAAADADDLVVPWQDGAGAKAVVRMAPDLAKRGARIWLAGIRDADLAAVAALPIAGCVVRRPLHEG